MLNKRKPNASANFLRKFFHIFFILNLSNRINNVAIKYDFNNKIE